MTEPPNQLVEPESALQSKLFDPVFLSQTIPCNCSCIQHLSCLSMVPKSSISETLIIQTSLPFEKDYRPFFKQVQLLKKIKDHYVLKCPWRAFYLYLRNFELNCRVAINKALF